jgi:tRNA U34 5-methylaminomethyl-2-thiouridine-forming methyltransferase MnmC
METRLILTGDGSHTLFVPSLKEHYHSTFGAIRESSHIFIGAGFNAVTRDDKPVQIFEVGFGTGLNAWLTLLESSKLKLPVHYTAIESDPVERSMIESLNYPELLNQSSPQFLDLHEAQWGVEERITEHFFLKKIHGKIQDHELPGETYDLVYFDAFGPDVQPELWKVEIFRKLFNGMKPGAILVTYSVKGSVKRALKSAGFTLEKLPGPPGKREITRATKSPLASRYSPLASRNTLLANHK